MYNTREFITKNNWVYLSLCNSSKIPRGLPRGGSFDVKSGNAKLKPNQKDIKNAVEKGKIQYINMEDITHE